MGKNVLISVYNKSGILDFAKGLISLGFEIVSTGGTKKHLTEGGVKVTAVEDLTGFPEILGGRVKTLHPKVFAGILAEKDNKGHKKDMEKNGLSFFDLIVVDLYPFKDTISKPGISVEEAIEQIDIGGVSLIRAAAKNFKYVHIIVSGRMYGKYIEDYKKYDGKFPYEYSLHLAREAFASIAEYDVEIEKYFNKLSEVNDSWIKLKSAQHLRYGENPHQDAVLYKENFDEIYSVLHGKELSYNNMLDIDAAYSVISEFKNDKPTCSIIKHGNPSGVATSDSLYNAYKRAFATDTASPYGGIIIFNKKLDLAAAMEADKIFSEIILAPGFDDDALELLNKKKNRRLVSFKFSEESNELRKITGGYLFQERDNLVLKPEELKVVSKKQPTGEQIKDLIFAYKVVKHTKSNAIVFVKDRQTLGVGAGQPSRIDSTEIAIMKSKEFNLSLKDSVVASDAFFPFPDNVIEISKVKASCIIHPGGSVRDEEVIKEADERGLCLVFTGYRHFKH
jgi:phosphoribosylaminoimidazolecarboxamide formyltransferase / IMP cyclohydrolase